MKGDSGIGKTCLVERYNGGGFSHEPVATIGIVFKQQTIEKENTILKINITDTAG